MATSFDSDSDSDRDKNATVADEVTPASSTGDGGGGSDGDIHDIATFAGEGTASRTTEGAGGGVVEGTSRTTESSGPASSTTESGPAAPASRTSSTGDGGGGSDGDIHDIATFAGEGTASRTTEGVDGGVVQGTSRTTESSGPASRTTESGPAGTASRTTESGPASWTIESGGGGGAVEGTSRTTESSGGGAVVGTVVSWTTEITVEEDNGDGGVRGDSEGDSHENVAVEGTPASRATEITIENEYHSGGVGGGDDSDDQLQSVELIFKGKEVPSWREQLTIRCFVVSFVLGVLFTFVVMKLNLTTGIIPSLNGCAGLLGFFFVNAWIKFVEKSGMLKQPFTRQENTVIQTCVVTTYGIAVSGGFGSYLIGMSSTVPNLIIVSNDAQNTKDPSLPWIIGFLFTVSFLGLFTVLPLRKIMIIDYKLIYPGGTSHLINSLHAPQGAKLAKKRLRTLGKFFSFNFLWGFFQWFFTAGDGCGFANFPTFGLKAFENRFYFDFSATYVGVGMICPYLINISILVGAILSWGLMWPLINNRKGDWYAANISDNSLHGLQGYRVFISIAMILGDGLYNFIKALSRMIQDFMKQYKNKEAMPVIERDSLEKLSNSFDDEVRTKLFLKDQIPLWVSISGYVVIAAVSIGVIPQIFHQMKWYYLVVIYIIAPVLAFCNAYGCGLIGWSLAPTYGMIAIFAIGAWAGASHGGVLAGLAACGVMMNIVSAASDLMQDFNTGYKTLASPKSMFISQVIGTAMGCVISPCVFWLFYKAFSDLGSLDSEYPAPYASVYRYISVLSVEGFGSLPDHCLTLCYIFFFGAIIINLIRDTVAKKWEKYIPLPMAMAIPFYIGSYFAIDMCFGSLILFIWGKLNRGEADAFGPVVASGLICGDGMWTLLSSLLALARVQPPICMKFLSRGTNSRVDAFLGA